jgi:hypothetical protein
VADGAGVMGAEHAAGVGEVNRGPVALRMLGKQRT